MYLIDEAGQAVSRQVPEPGPQDLQILVEHLAERIGRALEKQGLIERDMENAWLADFSQAGPLDDLVGDPSRNAAPWAPGRAEAVHVADRRAEASSPASAGLNLRQIPPEAVLARRVERRHQAPNPQTGGIFNHLQLVSLFRLCSNRARQQSLAECRPAHTRDRSDEPRDLRRLGRYHSERSRRAGPEGSWLSRCGQQTPKPLQAIGG